MNKNIIQEQALDEINKHQRCGVAISMGVGKTRLAIKHLQQFDDKTIALVVIPKLSIKESWLEELKKLNLQIELEFVTYRSLNKKDPDDYDIVYLDECHNLLYKHDKFLINFNGRILGLTGTPPKNAMSEKYNMVYKYCHIVYTYTVDDATEDKILNDYKIFIHTLSLSTDLNLKKKKRGGGFWYSSESKDYNWLSNKVVEANTRKQKQFSSIMRMRGLMEYTTKEKYAIKLLRNISGKCLVFCNTIAQSDKLCTHSYNSKNKKSKDNLELFSNGSIDRLSCVLQLSEGITIPGLKQGIILHSYGNERKSAQRIGRLLRLNPDETAICHILCYNNTVDETWVNKALEGFDQNKIEFFNPLNFPLNL
jgi:superfamily II DNA or RNA helicase